MILGSCCLFLPETDHLEKLRQHKPQVVIASESSFNPGARAFVFILQICSECPSSPTCASCLGLCWKGVSLRAWGGIASDLLAQFPVTRRLPPTQPGAVEFTTPGSLWKGRSEAGRTDWEGFMEGEMWPGTVTKDT